MSSVLEAPGGTRAIARPAVDLLLRALVALAAGAAVAAALPPVSAVVGILGFAVLFAILSQRRSWKSAALIGWCFGYGYYQVGLYWVAIAFYTDPDKFGAMAIPADIALSVTCALFPALVAALVALRRWRSPLLQAVAFAALWTLADYFRGRWGPQFPWIPIATIWAAATPVLQWTAWIGTPGLTFLSVLAASLPGTLFIRREAGRRWHGPLLALCLALLVLAAGQARLWFVALPPDTGKTVRLVQAAVDQKLKWNAELREKWFLRHVEMSRMPLEPGLPPLSVVVWPESAVPYAIDREPVVRDYLGSITPPGGYLVTGGDYVWDDQGTIRANNALWLMGAGGSVLSRYAKVDLVPFGEFLPLRPVLSRIGLSNLTAGSFDFTPGTTRVTMSAPGIPPFSPLICYEAIFPGDAVADDAPRPGWLLNITNDAWFGDSAGPYQHLAMARTRAVEEGMPLVRAANTGISVVTDAFGRVRKSLPLGSQGVLDAVLPGAFVDPPFYAGHLWFPLALVLLASAGAVIGDTALGQGSSRRRIRSAHPGA